MYNAINLRLKRFLNFLYANYLSCCSLADVGDRVTIGRVMTVWNIKTAHRGNLLGTVIIMPTGMTLSPTLLALRLLSFGRFA